MAPSGKRHPTAGPSSDGIGHFVMRITLGRASTAYACQRARAADVDRSIGDFAKTVATGGMDAGGCASALATNLIPMVSVRCNRGNVVAAKQLNLRAQPRGPREHEENPHERLARLGQLDSPSHGESEVSS